VEVPIPLIWLAEFTVMLSPLSCVQPVYRLECDLTLPFR
jgi:hypothetical protein